jgi:hypothetical protein
MAVALGVHSSNAATSNTSLTTPSRTSQASGSTFFGCTFTLNGSGANTFTDSKSNVYTLVTGSPVAGNAGSTDMRCWYKQNGVGGTLHTATGASNQAFGPTVFWVEATGCEVSGGPHASSMVQDSTSPYTASVTCTVDCILFAVLLGSSESTATHAESSGFTIIEDVTNGVSFWTGCLAYKIVTPGTYTVSFTESSSGASNGPPFAVALVAFPVRGLQTFSYTGSGGMTLGGTAARAKIRGNLSPSGGLNFGGTGNMRRGFQYAPSGGLQLGGTGVRSMVRVKSAAGGLQMGGAATVSFNAGTQSYSYTASGGMVLSGTAARLSKRLILPSGGLILGGSAAQSSHEAARIVVASGGLIFGGAATIGQILAGGSTVYLVGTALSNFGVIQVIFLNDVTPVPSTARFIKGIAHDPNGFRYVANWPVSGIVSYVSGRAIRPDGAQVIITDNAVPFMGGYGYTARGELTVTLTLSSIYIAGIAVSTGGKSSTSATA